MGSCECYGNGSGCKCNISIDSKVNSDSSKSDNYKNSFWKENKNWILTTASGMVIFAYSLTTYPNKTNEKLNYDAINNQLKSIESYENISSKYSVENLDRKLGKENLNYYKYALKEDSASIANSFEYQSYNEKFQKTDNAILLGLGITTIGMLVGLYKTNRRINNLRKKLRN